MILWTILIPPAQFLFFLTCGRLLNRTRLSLYTIASMGILLAILLSDAANVIEGQATLASLGVWMVSGLFEVNCFSLLPLVASKST